jgi:hypothetical protein
MSMQLSSPAKALFAAAKGDGPNAAARAKIWSGVAAGAGLGVAAGTTSIAAGASASASKLIAIGALLGSAVTVGLTLAVLKVATPHAATVPPTVLAPSVVSPSEAAMTSSGGLGGGLGVSPRRPGSVGVLPNGPGGVGVLPNGAGGLGVSPDRSGVAGEPARAAASQLELDVANVAPPGVSGTAPVGVGGGGDTTASGDAKSAAAPAVTAGARHGATTKHFVKQAPIEDVEEDPLMHEAALVAEARGSLVRGDALGALRTIRAASGLRQRALEPEELSIESRALRAMGRDTEAAGVDAELRSRFPDHALSR